MTFNMFIYVLKFPKDYPTVAELLFLLRNTILCFMFYLSCLNYELTSFILMLENDEFQKHIISNIRMKQHRAF